MLELKEVEKREPTEDDLSAVFKECYGAAFRLQRVMKEVFAEYKFKHPINCDKIEFSISPECIVLRMGDMFFFHELREWVTELPKGE